MTTISSGGFDNSPSPFPRVRNAVRRDVSAGTISASDETALTSALGDIASQLFAAASGTSGRTGAAATATTAPAAMKDRVASLIGNEVSSGKLTTDQGSELKTAFEQAYAPMHGVHGHHGGGSMLAALTDASATDATSSSDPTAASTPSASSLETAATTAVSAMEAFITQFKSALNSNGLYGSNGASSSSSSATSLLVNSIG